MKKRLIRLTAFIVLLGTMICGNAANAQKVRIDETNFPDEGLRNQLIDGLNLSQEADGNYYVETNDVTKLKIDCEKGQAVKNLKGIELFTVIKEIELRYVKATSIDLSKFTDLDVIDFYHTELNSVDASSNKKLKSFSMRCNGGLTSVKIPYSVT